MVDVFMALSPYLTRGSSFEARFARTSSDNGEAVTQG
jgi:hypothetical protein